MRKCLFFVLLLSLSSLAFASNVTIDFEQLPEFTQVTNQYAGFTFTNALQLDVPDYDYFDYPPHSGSGLITNDPNDPIIVNLSLPGGEVTDFSGWYTAPFGLTVTAYDSSGVVIGSFVDSVGNDGTNAQFDIASAGISWVTISTSGGADGLTVDDISATVPEPGSLALLGPGLLAIAGIVRRKIKR